MSLDEKLYNEFYEICREQSPKKTENLSKIFGFVSKAAGLSAVISTGVLVYDFLWRAHAILAFLYPMG